jgi:hypothetical protein
VYGKNVIVADYFKSATQRGDQAAWTSDDGLWLRERAR